MKGRSGRPASAAILALLAVTFAAAEGGCSSSGTAVAASGAGGSAVAPAAPAKSAASSKKLSSAITPASGRAPYDAPPAAAHKIEVFLHDRAARDILASLARPRFESSDPKVLQDLPAIQFAIRDSGRDAAVFEHDFAAAFDPDTRSSVFDFHSIREAKDRWQTLLDAIAPRLNDIAAMASTRAAALLPGDRPVSARLDVFLSFGLPGLGDHIVLRGENGREAMVLDLARALGDSDGEPLDSRISRIARVVAGEVFRSAWASYRAGNPAWMHPDPQLGELDILLRAVAEAGPVSVYTVDENFFPLSVWLKEPMKRALEDLNRRSDRIVEAAGNLERRMDLTAEIKRGDFARRVAGQDGAYLVDGVIQVSGLSVLRHALELGPKAFFQAYEKASQTDRDLPPLSKPIRDQLAGVAPKPASSAPPAKKTPAPRPTAPPHPTPSA